ncbi:MAG: efflux RND transporter periplasmic adaptor subunit [Syntrophobacteraceae bacterium]
MNRSARRVSTIIILLCLALGAAWVWKQYFRPGKEDSAALFRTATVTREDIQSAISASGTVEPEELVDVGAQVAGKIVSFGSDAAGQIVDYGSSVKQGMVLAQIDDTLYAADAAQYEAQLGQAKAAVVKSEADLLQLKAKLVQAERDWNRARKLGPSDALSQSAYDAAQSDHEVARANVAVGEAAITQAKKGVAQAEASLARARQNLAYCTIKSPVDGVIIDRRVNIGQTVVSSLNAPSLFLIAKDLKRLEVWIAVNEADIGKVRVDQPVVFTVDAFQGKTFVGKVSKIRLNASVTQNVVTYTVEVATDNSDGVLLPYLTANAKFVLGERSNVLTVPNSALRWRPRATPSVLAGKVGGESEGGGNDARQASGSGGETAHKSHGSAVWVLRDGTPERVPVRAGLTDGVRTEIESGEIKEGMEIVIGTTSPNASSGSNQQAKSPFTPQLMRGGRH